MASFYRSAGGMLYGTAEYEKTPHYRWKQSKRGAEKQPETFFAVCKHSKYNEKSPNHRWYKYHQKGHQGTAMPGTEYQT
jgi:hypothetical protein